MPTKHESISSWVDGVEPTDNGQPIAALASDADARATWARYHLIGDVLRNENAPYTPSFAQLVAEQIASEPTILMPQVAKRPAHRPLLGFAIAASVATVAVLGARQLLPTDVPGGAVEPAVAVVATPNPVTPVALTEPERTDDALSDSFKTQRRLNSYLVKFNEQRSSVGVPSVNPYVRIVGFESE